MSSTSRIINNQGYPSIDYRLESARLASYENRMVPYMSPSQLAAAGFFYTGNTDHVKCFECGIEIFEWVEGDNPMSDHQRWRPICKFVRMIPCGNVPIGVDPDTIPIPAQRSRDVYGVDYRPDASPDYRTEQEESQFSSTVRVNSLRLYPKHLEYTSYESRLRTFDNWLKSLPPTKEQLADAGFYYTGRYDETRCYHCSGVLEDWEPTDDPWEQHAKWFTKCYHVLTVKGQLFIDRFIGQREALLTREKTVPMNLHRSIENVEEPLTRIENNQEEEMNPAVASTSFKSNNADDGRICKICYNNELGVVFLPCRHMSACVTCASSMTECPVCRGSIEMSVRAIIS